MSPHLHSTTEEWLANVPEWMPQSRTLAVVALHPDDETLGAGGLIHTCAELGYEITIILVTDGEGGRAEVSPLAHHRYGELRAALMRLAPDGAHVARLCLPHGKVALHEQELVQRLMRTIPLDCTLVAPYERDGDVDRKAISLACQTAAIALSVPCVRYPISAWHRARVEEIGSQCLRRVPLDESARRAKHQAIACYESLPDARPGGAMRPYEVFIV